MSVGSSLILAEPLLVRQRRKRTGNGGQVSFSMALSDIQSQRMMFTDSVRVVGEEVGTRGAREPIQHFHARSLDEVPHFETTSPSRPRVVLRIRIDLATGFFEERLQPPAARLQRTYVCA